MAVIRDAHQVDAHDRMPFGRGRLGCCRIIAHGRVVDQDVQAAEFPDTARHGLQRQRGVAHIGLVAQHTGIGHRLHNGLARAFQTLRIGVYQKDRSAFLTKDVRCGRTNARTRARDQRHLALQTWLAHAAHSALVPVSLITLPQRLISEPIQSRNWLGVVATISNSMSSKRLVISGERTIFTISRL